MHITPFIITGIMLAFWNGIFGMLVYFSLRERAPKKWFGVVGGLLVMYGVTSFFLTGLCADCGTDIVPTHFEWPMGLTNGILTTPSGMHVAPHDAAGRVQIYDSNWKFVRGWHIDGGGGTFKLCALEGERFEAITARGNSKFTYDLNGTLISASKYDGKLWNTFPQSRESKYIATWPWMWPLVHPFLAMLTLILGFVVLFVGGKVRVRPFSRKRTT